MKKECDLTNLALSMLSLNGKKASEARATLDSLVAHSFRSASVRGAGAPFSNLFKKKKRSLGNV